jgi:hypothetical protein
MGSIVTLGLGRLEVDWGKNSHYANHSKLFLPSDKKLVSHFYGDPQTEGIIEELKPGLARPLHSVKRRLELLGYNMATVRRQYEEAAATLPDGYDVPETSFDLFAKTLAAVDVRKVALDPFFADHSLGDFAARSILGDPEFTKTAENLKGLSRWDGQFFENLDPYVVLRLLAENPANLDLEVQWRYADLVDGGWAEEDSMFEALSAADRWLIVTEGSSDGHIIRKALDLLRPDITDFFDFVDMSENYPFTGTGNLFRFCQGLAQIRIQNKVLVIFDNDAAGREAQRKVDNLPLPSNMRVVRLPDLPECRRFPTIGPNGKAEEDINGRGVSIELFLDLRGEDLPCVRWTAYNSSTETYQGELLRKEIYTKQFMEARSFGANYDTSKLQGLLDHLYDALTKLG